MAVEEYYTPELCIYTVEPRKDKGDEYTMRKLQKDRAKLYQWMTELLRKNEMIIFHEENGKEVHTVCTGKPVDTDVADAPLTVVEYRGTQFVQCHWLQVIEYPGRQPKNIHIDSVKRFILKNDNVGDIAKDLYYTKK